MKTYAFVFARGGSKGLPGKNLLKIGGISLIGRAIRTALAVPDIQRVIVSTDDSAIAEEARVHGAETPFVRPAELAQDDSPEWASWRHAVQWLADSGDTFDEFLSVPATAPLRLPEDIANALAVFRKGTCDLVMSMTEAQRSPYFTIVAEQPDGFFLPAIRLPHLIHRRQDSPAVYDLTPVAYVTSPDHIMSVSGYYESRILPNFVPLERAIDIDTDLDFKMAQIAFAQQSKSHTATQAGAA